MKLVFLNLWALLFYFTACTQTVDVSQTETKNNITYLIGDTVPYSGIVVSYHKKNILAYRSHYKNGLLNGLHTTYFTNGEKSSELTYVDFYLNGPATYWYENGKISAKGNFEHCSEEGFWVYFYENGNKKSEGNYHHGQKKGLWKFYDENGNLKESREFIAEEY